MIRATQSHAWYKAVLVEKILERDEYDGIYRRLIYYDGAKQRGYISEMYFQVEGSRSYQRAWRDKMRNVIRSIRKGSAQWNGRGSAEDSNIVIKAGYSVKIGRQQIESTGGKKQMEYTVEYWEEEK